MIAAIARCYFVLDAGQFVLIALPSLRYPNEFENAPN
jgi:hypothetical protein